jgi:hypothetical protein
MACINKTEIIFIRGGIVSDVWKKGLSNGEPISISRFSEPGSAKQELTSAKKDRATFT